MVLTFTLSCLLFGQASTSGPAFYKNTDEMVGVVSRWPRGAALVFENQIQLVECDSIDSIEAWSPTHLKLSTVFGQTVEIDVRKVWKAEASIWDKKPSPTKEVNINSLKGKFVGPANQSADYLVKPGLLYAIGHSQLKGTYFSVNKNAKATEVRSEDGKVRISLRKDSSPVLIKDSGNYLAIMPGNSRFAPLKVFKGRTSRILVSDAETFYVLRVKAIR